MTIWKVKGGTPLEGSISVQGAKNAVLPILAASVVSGGVSRVKRCPELSDVDASLDILRFLGCSVMQNGGEILVDSEKMYRCEIPHTLMTRMRSSVIFLGAVLARCGEARLSLPGGCELGSRPIDLHLKALRELGAEITEQGGEIFCRASGLHGAQIHLEFPSVGATENVMLAACRAKGDTVLTNAAREPEIVDLQVYLNSCGADISGAGTPLISIRGADKLSQYAEHTLLPDRIAASTYLCAVAAVGGELCLKNVVPPHFAPVLSALSDMGCKLSVGDGEVRIKSTGRLKAGKPILTKPFPGFPTDAQALYMSACLCAEGTSVFVENIFENRFRHVPEFRRMGADIRTEGRVAMVSGVERIFGAEVYATDLRGGAALVLAGLKAEGETTVYDSGHIDRGYDSLDGALRSLGANIRKETITEEKENEKFSALMQNREEEL